MNLKNRKILLGVTGGVAAYKAAELVRLLIKEGASVQVAMSEAATHFVGTATFQSLSGHAVFTDQWDTRIPNNMAHIDLSRAADAILIAPASADFIAKVAHGLAGDLLSTLVLARNCPLLVAPAMNKQMWENPATRRNIATLRADGITILGPASGDQACGETGDGRMLEAAEIVEDLIASFQPRLLAGKRVMVTAGPTFEAIDPVRGITNLSSGRMGYALARAAREAGARVTLISGPVNLGCPRGVTRIDVQSADQMRDAVLTSANAIDIFISVAAVADYRVTNRSVQKLKKEKPGKPPVLELEENPDILAQVAALPNPPYCVGFAAESENLEEYAQKKRRKKNIPLIVANLIQDGLGGDTNTIVLFDETGSHELPPASKISLARQLVAEIVKRQNPRF